MLKITTKVDEIKEIIYKSEKHDNWNILKSPKTDNNYLKKRSIKDWIRRK